MAIEARALTLWMVVAFSLAVAWDAFATAKDRDWKVVYTTTEGPEGRALELLTAELGPLMLRDDDFHSFHVLPLEREGGPSVDRKNRIVLGTWNGSKAIRSLLMEGDVPKGGYFVRARAEDGTNIVVIAGDRPVDALYGAVDFIEDGLPSLAARLCDGVSYRSQVFDGDLFDGERRHHGVYASRRVPESAVRSLFTWGHVIDDYRQYFREVARFKLNRVILWNEHPPVNAADVVAYAHSWGIEVFWGFSWGWSTDCITAERVELKSLVESVYRDWREKWRDLPGDGIYFQTFTEKKSSVVRGETTACRAVRLVNAVVPRIRADRPDLRIVFGLHADGMRDELDVVSAADPSLEILWENCGGFPFTLSDTAFSDDLAFVRRIVGGGHAYGLAIKGQLLQDWTHWDHQSGPYLLGCAGPAVLSRDRSVALPLLSAYVAKWVAKGDRAYRLIRAVRSSANPPAELNTVVEYNPPFDFSTALVAELLWSCAEPYETIRARVLNRVRDKN